jgi:CRISPR/Cas system CMR-associated protein Cmr3 (group 5 of RAMP superfamily)
MIFSLENRFLEVLSRLTTISMTTVSETAVQDHLKLPYKKLHEIASFWQTKGCVKSMTLRGGISHYQLTSLGLIEVENFLKKKRRIIIWIQSISAIVVILCLILILL